MLFALRLETLIVYLIRLAFPHSRALPEMLLEALTNATVAPIILLA